jgi:hypothetical protein
MTLRDIEQTIVNGRDTDLPPEIISRMKAHVGVAMQKSGVLNDTLLDRLGHVASGIYQAGANRPLKPLTWISIPQEGDKPTRYAASTVFGPFCVYHLNGRVLLRVDGVVHEQYECSLEEARDRAEKEVYARMVADLFV